MHTSGELIGVHTSGELIGVHTSCELIGVHTLYNLNMVVLNLDLGSAVSMTNYCQWLYSLNWSYIVHM